jgi:ABC-2 type transport system permease protein
MFALSSLVSRGLADDAAGLAARLRSGGFGDFTIITARCLVMTLIGTAQIIVTLAWAAVFFGIVPDAPVAILTAGAMGAFCISAFFALVAAVCGRRGRFVAVAPVLTLVLAGLSGAFIPRFLLPPEVASAGGMLFPCWMIDACRAAIDGRLDLLRILGLPMFGLMCMVGAAAITRWKRAA